MRRVGLVVPPDNATAELETHRALRDRASVYVARLDAWRTLPMRERLHLYNEHLEAPIDRLSGLGLSGILVACTGSSYELDPAADDALYEKLSEAAGCTVRGACGCIRDALSRGGIGRITLVSPYEPWLSELSARYWECAGIEVTATFHVDGTRHPYDIGPEEAAAVLDRVLADPPPGTEAVLMTGTGVETIDTVASRCASGGLPVFSSMSCGVAWMSELG